MQYGRILSSIAQGCRVNVIRVGVEGHYFPLDRVEYQLVEERIVGLDEALNVLVWYSHIHLQVLAYLLDHLRVQGQLSLCSLN